MTDFDEALQMVEKRARLAIASYALARKPELSDDQRDMLIRSLEQEYLDTLACLGQLVEMVEGHVGKIAWIQGEMLRR